MVAHSTVLRTLGASALALLLAGCGAPLSAQWQGYPLAAPTTQGPAESPDSAPANAPAPVGPDCAKVRCVALTFDDGPGTYTEPLLDILDKHNAKATFFVIGKNVKKHPEIVRQALARGHEIGNHGWSHQDLANLSLAAGQRDLSKADEAVQEATGAKPTLVRPPFGSIPKSLSKSLTVPVALWSIDTLDWQTRDTKKTVKAATNAKPGSIILMHDIHKSTIDAVPKILTDLESRDFHFVTVSQLIGNPKPGIGYGTGQKPATAGED